MKRLMAVALLTFAAAAALADDAPAPDYSQPALLSFTREVLRQRAAERFDIDWGAIDIYHFGTHVKLLWLPFLAPEEASVCTKIGSLTWQEYWSSRTTATIWC